MILINWILELFYWLLNGLSVFVPFDFDHTLENPTHTTPIVIVHGWMTGNVLYLFFKWYLEKKGFRVYMPNLGLQMEDLHIYPKILSNYLKEKQIKEPVLVGISTGGLVSIEYAQKIDGWKTVKKLITIATPFKGSYAAYLSVLSKSVKQLRPNSAYMRYIDESVEAHPQKVVHLVAKADQLVYRTSSTLPGIKTIIIPVIGHVKLHAFSQKTFEAVARIAGG
ncbi:MAG: esterase/lipase family protein [Candidatus Levyibacteriota bacterium]